MMAFKLTDATYREGADRIATVRRVNDPAVVVEDIEKMLRAYVGAAVDGKFPKDFSDMMSEADKTRLVNAVVVFAGSEFAIRLSAARVLVNLQLLEVFGGRGEVSPALAKPIEWASRGGEYQATAPVIKPKDIATATGEVFSKFFGGLFSSGTMLPLMAAAVALIFVSRRK